MRRFAFALFLSIILHAALLASLPGARTESAPREVMRISLTSLPGDGSGGGEGNGDEIVASVNDPEVRQFAQTQPIEQAVTSAPPIEPTPEPAPILIPTPAPTPAPALVPTLAPVPEPEPKPEPVFEPEHEPETEPEPVPAPAPAPEPVLTPDLSGTGGSSGNEVNSGGGNELDGESDSNEDTIIDASRLTVTKRIPAEYPMISRRRRDQGTVVLILDIRSGRVTKAEIEKSSGHSALDESAKKAVSAWEFDTSGFEEPLSARISFVFSLTQTH